MLGRSLVSVVLCAMVAAVFPSTAMAAEEYHPEWGSTSAPDGVLKKKGCKRYSYSYAVTPPEGEWSLELFFTGPRGRQVWSATFYGTDPQAATETMRLCRTGTRPGRYTITALVSSFDGPDYVEGWLPPSHFRLHKPKRH